MSNLNKKTNISWANRTWNVIAGCEKVSPACKIAMLCLLAIRQKMKVFLNIRD